MLRRAREPKGMPVSATEMLRAERAALCDTFDAVGPTGTEACK